MERVLVVGGAGYIGSHMLLKLQDANYKPAQVLVFDNLSRGFEDACGAVSIWRGDLCNGNDIDACIRSFQPSLVMHFGALAYVGESVEAPELYYQNNVVGSLNLLAAMLRHGVQRLVFSSTCATYGEPEQVPIPEDHPQRPINPYGQSKLVIEQVLRDYATAYGLGSVSLRYFNAAGADPLGRARERHQPESHLIPLVLAEAARLKSGGHPSESNLQVFGDDFPTPDGSCIRDYIHIEDLCTAHLKAGDLLKSPEHERKAHVFNLANGTGYSVFEVIEACRQVTGQKITAKVVGRRAGDPARLVGLADSATQRLGWVPSYQLLDMVRHAWEAGGFPQK